MPDTEKNLAFSSTSKAVRQALEGLRADYLERTVSKNLCGIAELVLAEALNDVVEHATARQADGRVRLALAYDPPFLTFDLRDNGAPMPGLSLPKGAPPCIETAIENLPEGGFGWSLIHALAQNIEYRRKNGWNYLRFRLSDDP